jgi:hypothetical protein
MGIAEQIEAYIDSRDKSKRADMQTLHQHMLQMMPKARLWFLDGKDETGKTVTNPSVGYGEVTIPYKDGTSREYYQVGISSNTSGISVYFMGLKDKTYLKKAFETKIGKASVTSYCIKFRALKDIDMSVLDEAIRSRMEQSDRML